MRTATSVALFAVIGVLQASAASKRILHLSDIHLNLSTTFDEAESAQIPIRYLDDTPITLLESALRYAVQVIPDPDMLLYTGDHVAFGRNHTKDYVQGVVERNVRMIEKFYPFKPTQLQITAILGNADSSPGYHMPVATATPPLASMSNAWKPSLSPKNLDLFAQHGYLMYELDQKLSVITLNTVVYSHLHKPNSTFLHDPLGQFEWLKTNLHQLRQQGKFAYIAGHIPPIVDSHMKRPMWMVAYLRAYQSIVRSFNDVIKAQMFGHVHSVEFRLDDPFSPSHSSPPLFTTGSISPRFGNNPSFTVWEYDTETYDLLDFQVYATNISSSKPLDWKPVFRPTKVYGINSLSISSLQQLHHDIIADPVLQDRYYWGMKAHAYNLPPCTTLECRARLVCTLTWWSTSEDYEACIIARTAQAAESPLPSSHIALGVGASAFAYIALGVALLAIKRFRRPSRLRVMQSDDLKLHRHHEKIAPAVDLV